MQIDFQRSPYSPEDFREWLKNLPDEFRFCPQSATGNLLAKFFEERRGNADGNPVVCHDYCVRADGDESLFGASWPATVSDTLSWIVADHNIPPSATHRSLSVSCAREYLLARLSEFV
jgi:hypothetical protein